VAELGQVPKDFVAWSESGDLRADRLDLACCIKAEAAIPWLAQPDAHPREEWPAVQVVEVALIERCRADAHQHLVVLDDRLVHLPECQDLG
jgi:hypothetical protein